LTGTKKQNHHNFSPIMLIKMTHEGHVRHQPQSLSARTSTTNLIHSNTNWSV